MKDKMREPNLGPNSCTDINLVGFKYLNYVRSENKDEWVKEQMSDPRRVAVLLQTHFQENPSARIAYMEYRDPLTLIPTERQYIPCCPLLFHLKQQDICGRILSKAYDQIKSNI